jgi:hypothetical protein
VLDKFRLTVFEFWFAVPPFAVISSHSSPRISVIMSVPRRPAFTKSMDAAFYFVVDIKKNAKRKKTENQINPDH